MSYTLWINIRSTINRCVIALRVYSKSVDTSLNAGTIFPSDTLASSRCLRGCGCPQPSWFVQDPAPMCTPRHPPQRKFGRLRHGPMRLCPGSTHTTKPYWCRRQYKCISPVIPVPLSRVRPSRWHRYHIPYHARFHSHFCAVDIVPRKYLKTAHASSFKAYG